ncbi:hypothetical protein [Cellulomonas timonensis]|uniref:hypothetical protein n=1 Tax=Cellulomonas timonensis TaxID=1689271 RepID=UPI00083092E5|nr:hypothetical protein [Cellulomonas timonensis]
MTQADVDGKGLVDVIEWHGRNGMPLVRPPTTHLGLIVLAETNALRLVDGPAPGSLSAQGEVRAEHAFLVPAAVVNEHARALWSARANGPSNGRYRYLKTEYLRGHSLLAAESVE